MEKTDQKEFLKSLCTTDKEVEEVVGTIRKDIVPVFQRTVKMAGSKVLVRKIFIKEREKLESGLMVEGVSRKNLLAYYETHPFQAVVIAAGPGFDNGPMQKEVIEVRPGDHILCRSEVPCDDLQRGGVVIGGYIFGFIWPQDIVCIVSRDENQRAAPKPYKEPEERIY